MEKLWCWRCKKVVPMLSEKEFSVFEALMKKYLRGKVLGDNFIQLWRNKRKILKYYKKIGGMKVNNPYVIVHHYRGLYGEKCENCGKPYRTKEASFCEECGHEN